MSRDSYFEYELANLSLGFSRERQSCDPRLIQLLPYYNGASCRYGSRISYTIFPQCNLVIRLSSIYTLVDDF